MKTLLELGIAFFEQENELRKAISKLPHPEGFDPKCKDSREKFKTEIAKAYAEKVFLTKDGSGDWTKVIGTCTHMSYPKNMSMGQMKGVLRAVCYKTTKTEKPFVCSDSAPCFTDFKVDLIGTSAEMPLMGLLNSMHEGKTLARYILDLPEGQIESFAGDYLSSVQGLRKAHESRKPCPSGTSPQVYFPVDKDYHLVTPLFPTVFLDSVSDRLLKMQISEGRFFPRMGVRHFGGAHPKNVSPIHEKRGGDWPILFGGPPSISPSPWRPTATTSYFDSVARFDKIKSGSITELLGQLYWGLRKGSFNEETREQRDEIVSDILLEFIQSAEALRNDPSSWSSKSRLDLFQRYWLNPLAFEEDEVPEMWKTRIADRFVMWLNKALNKQRELEVKKFGKDVSLFSDHSGRVWEDLAKSVLEDYYEN